MSDDKPTTFPSAPLQDELDALVGAAIRSIDARRRGKPSSRNAVDVEVSGAIKEMDGRSHDREKLRKFARELADAARVATNKVAALPARLARRRNIHDPDVSGDAAAVTINARRELMESMRPHTFIVPEKGALICNCLADIVIVLGEDGCELPTIGKDFGYNPQTGEWVDDKPIQ